MNKFGDTPLGMVESAMEFLRVCKNENFDQVVLSMKSSNPIVMIHAYTVSYTHLTLPTTTIV